MTEKDIPINSTYDSYDEQSCISELSIESEKDVTLEDILNEANKLWDECKKKNIPLSEYKQLEKHLEEVIRDHKQLYQSYPTVIRHMVEERQYHPKAFKMYLRKVAQKPWKNDEERMDSYADYAVMLYRALNTRYNQTQIRLLWKDYRTRLQREHDDFLQKFDKFEKEEKERVTTREKKRIDETIAGFEKVARKNELPEENINALCQLLRDGKIKCEDLDIFTSELARKLLTPNISDTEATIDATDSTR